MRTIRHFDLRAFTLGWAVLTLTLLLSNVAEAQSLWVWQQRIAWQFKVDQLPPADMQSLQATAAAKDLLIFDVREPDEFAVSHLQGAQQVHPAITPEAFLQRYGDQIAGKTLVFYCSIGWRSSELADRLSGALTDRRAEQVHNLRGGIFRWHNESRPLINANGATDWVHPYSPDWANLVERQGRTSYQPR